MDWLSIGASVLGGLLGGDENESKQKTEATFSPWDIENRKTSSSYLQDIMKNSSNYRPLSDRYNSTLMDGTLPLSQQYNLGEIFKKTWRNDINKGMNDWANRGVVNSTFSQKATEGIAENLDMNLLKLYQDMYYKNLNAYDNGLNSILKPINMGLNSGSQTGSTTTTTTPNNSNNDMFGNLGSSLFKSLSNKPATTTKFDPNFGFKFYT